MPPKQIWQPIWINEQNPLLLAILNILNRFCFFSKLSWLGKSPGKIILDYLAVITEFSAVLEGSSVHQNWFTRYLFFFLSLIPSHYQKASCYRGYVCKYVHSIIFRQQSWIGRKCLDGDDQYKQILISVLNKSLSTQHFSRALPSKVPLVLTTTALKFM